MQRLPQPIPHGWYFVHYGDELAANSVVPLRYFERDLVLFRTAAGRAVLMDAHCPHLGAHLGYGGSVQGESIRCPFHAWSFDRTGTCTGIPYARSIPQRARGACVYSYPVMEKNQVIWAWYHPERAAPPYEVADNPEVGAPDWAPLKKYQWRFASSPQEIAENGVDIAHFKFVHGMDEVPDGSSEYHGHVRRSTAAGLRTVTFPDGTTRQLVSRVETVQNGAGQKWTRFSGTVETLLQVMVTPIDSADVELRFAFTHRRFPEGSFEDRIVRGQIESIIGQGGVAGDIPIWQHKIHRAEPVLCDGDGPNMRFRRYLKHFYTQPSQPIASDNRS
jgi:phenylpropionate dioxygenase-like ring-hydroxylating dioxygenase large terminal subunit